MGHKMLRGVRFSPVVGDDATINPTGLTNVDLSISHIFPETVYPRLWPNYCFNNVKSADGKTETSYWLGNHPMPIGNTVESGSYPDAPLTLGQYLGCASIPAAGLVSFYTGGTVTSALSAAGVAALGGYDNVMACANAFGALLGSFQGGGVTPISAQYPTMANDMAAMIQGMMNAGYSTGVGGLLDFQQSVGPDSANGPNGGTNAGYYYDESGADQYGYGGTGSLLQGTPENNWSPDVKPASITGLYPSATGSAPPPTTFKLDASGGYH